MSNRAVEQNWETSIRRRRLLIALFVLGLAFATPFAPNGAASAAQTSPDNVVIDVIEITGLLDPILVEFAEASLREAERDRAAALVVRLDTTGSVADPASVAALVERVRRSQVPVAVWTGPGREARADGAAFELFRFAAVRGMAPGARAGGLDLEEAMGAGLAPLSAATLGDFVVGLDGLVLADGRSLVVPTEIVERPGRPPQRQLAATAAVRFDEPSLLGQLLHAVTTPSAAYVLLVAGLLLIVFEFFTAGIGVAAATGAVSLVLAAYGLGALPTRPAALAVLVAAVVGFAVDVQAGAPRAWTVIGTLGFVAGSFFLFGDGLRVPLPVAAVIVVATVLLMVAGMPAMIRTRFSTPTIGRESMVGEQGTAVSAVDPEGVVLVRDAPWRARTNRATPIAAGDTVRVAGIDGLLLEVEPLVGAARDAGH